jgi:hypothetical protein
VGVAIDESWTNDVAFGIDLAMSGIPDPSDGYNEAGTDAHIGAKGSQSCAIDHRPGANDEVVC